MKISGMQVFTPYSLFSGGKAASARSDNNSFILDHNRRFDSFTMSGTNSKKDNSDDFKELDARKAELVRSLSMLSAEEKLEFAYDSYLDMQKSLYHIKDLVEIQVEMFSELKDKKAYYTDLIDSDCTVGEGGGKYKFLGYEEGSSIEAADVHSVLQKVQRSLDLLCGKIDEEDLVPNPLPEHVTGFITYEDEYYITEMSFRSASTVFSAVTGISDSALQLEPKELYFNKESVNEENFLEKANSLIDTITNRSKKLGDIMSEYSYNHRHLMDKLQDRLDSAERLEEIKGTSISKMIAKYNQCLFKAYSEYHTDFRSMFGEGLQSSGKKD